MALNPINFSLLFGSNQSSEKESFSYSSNWKRSISSELNEQQFSEHFRMSKDFFLRICSTLFLKASQIPIDNFKISMLLFLTYISHSVVYRLVRELFGISLSTAFRKIEYFSNFLAGVSNDFIKLPSLEEFPSLSEGFFNLAPEPGTVLVVDGSYIPINKPSVNGTKYFCRKKYYAINVLFFVDHRKIIRFITSGYGKNHDSRVYRNSNNIQNYVEGLPAGFHILGDAAFRGLTNIKVAENYERVDLNISDNIKKQRVIVENAIGLLKNKFRRLDHSQKNGETIKYMNVIIGACVIHNLIIDLNE